MKNLIIGAVSGNYSPKDLENWVETSNFKNVDRALILYNRSEDDLVDYLNKANIQILSPEFGYWGNELSTYPTNTGDVSLENSYNLIHNIRFFHIWTHLSSLGNVYDKVLITDVKDVYFNYDPFPLLEGDKITATSEIVKYRNESWNELHLGVNLGLIGRHLLLNEPVYNVGVFGGPISLIKDICADIYLMSVGKLKVADQTSYNYLIQTRYKNSVVFTEHIAAHLHVVNAGLVNIDLNNISKYSIVHQYDRIRGFKR